MENSETSTPLPFGIGVPRFDEKINLSDTLSHNGTACWIWKALVVRGYGQYKNKGRKHRAHKFAYEQLVGPVPGGLHLDHLCRNPLCVNPAHLEPMTCHENLHRSPDWVGNRTHCPAGHEYTEANTYVAKQCGGKYQNRMCRICATERQRQFRARKKAILDAAP